jgi:dTDP-3-amino-3,4,6-trideoxy-alpha-D-glucose transaminase
VAAIPFCDLAAAHSATKADTEHALLRVARSGRYVLGEEVAAFEREFALHCQAPHVVSVGSGTDALALILRGAGIGPGDEVIVPAYTAAATWMAVAWVGATPVGVDVDAVSGLIDVDSVAAAIGPATRAIIAVHLFGQPAPMAQLALMAEHEGLVVIEDAAHAAGGDATRDPAASHALAAAFSFYPTKALGALGDGGAIVTRDGGLAEAVRRLRSYGWTTWQGDSEKIGANSRLDELQAAVLRLRLERLNAVQQRLRVLAARYREQLFELDGLGLPPFGADGGELAWHQFVVRYAERDALRSALGERGVASAVHYSPLPPQLSVFAGTGRYPRAEDLARVALSLPFDYWLTDAQADAVCRAVVAAIGNAERS